MVQLLNPNWYSDTRCSTIQDDNGYKNNTWKEFNTEKLLKNADHEPQLSEWIGVWRYYRPFLLK